MLNDISVGAEAGFGVHTFLPFLSAKNFKNQNDIFYTQRFSVILLFFFKQRRLSNIR